MMRRLSLCCLLLSLSLFAVAQRVEKVHAEYLYHAPENISLEEAKRIALERAKLQAIADAFGTVVSQSNFTSASNRNGQSEMDFFSLGGSEVKGEWIETIGEPRYDISYEQEMLVVKASVTGRIRELVGAEIDFEAKVLCNGTEPKYERSDFRNGDDLYLYFRSPVDGYLNVYLLDETSQTVYCLLPYKNSDKASVAVKHDVPYVFFSATHADKEAAAVDEYVMTCSGETERNVLYIVFSPHDFVKVLSSETKKVSPRQTAVKDFQKWLAERRNKDNRMTINRIELTIKK